MSKNLNMKIVKILSSIEIQKDLINVHNGHNHFDDQKLNVQLKNKKFLLQRSFENCNQLLTLNLINVDPNGIELHFINTFIHGTNVCGTTCCHDLVVVWCNIRILWLKPRFVLTVIEENLQTYSKIYLECKK